MPNQQPQDPQDANEPYKLNHHISNSLDISE